MAVWAVAECLNQLDANLSVNFSSMIRLRVSYTVEVEG